MSFSVLVLALAAYSLPLFTLFVLLSKHIHHPQPCTGKTICHPGLLPSQSTRGQSAFVWHNRGTSFVLLWCSQFKQRKECWEQGTSLWREGGKDGRREGRRMRERTKWESARETDLYVCVCVWGGTNLREEMGALRVLSTPFSSSHSWEIWSTELGGTNTQTQINCCLENKPSFLFISLRCSVSPCWSSGSKRCGVNGARFQTLEHEKRIHSVKKKKGKIMKHTS